MRIDAIRDRFAAQGKRNVHILGKKRNYIRAIVETPVASIPPDATVWLTVVAGVVSSHFADARLLQMRVVIPTGEVTWEGTIAWDIVFSEIWRMYRGMAAHFRAVGIPVRRGTPPGSTCISCFVKATDVKRAAYYDA